MSQPPYQQPGYPEQQPGYPQQQPGYPQQQPQYAQQVPQQQGGYQQPGYPQPVEVPGQTYGGQTGYPPPPGPPAKKKSKGGLFIVIALVVLALCGGLSYGGYVFYQDRLAPIADAANISLVTPDKLGDRAKITTSDLTSLADGMKSDLAKDIPDATGSVAAFYGDLEAQDMVMVFGVSGPIRNPEKELDDAFAGMSTSGLTASNVTDVDPGSLGGEAKCGDSESEGVKLAICAWADHGSLGMVIFYFKTVADIKAEFVSVREQIEVKKS